MRRPNDDPALAGPGARAPGSRLRHLKRWLGLAHLIALIGAGAGMMIADNLGPGRHLPLDNLRLLQDLVLAVVAAATLHVGCIIAELVRKRDYLITLFSLSAMVALLLAVLAVLADGILDPADHPSPWEIRERLHQLWATETA